MFGISFGECLIVLLVAIFVLGPDKLPGAARLVGRVFARVQRLWQELKQDFDGIAKK